jgi:hypothetical protein
VKTLATEYIHRTRQLCKSELKINQVKEYFFQLKEKRQGQQYNDEDFLQPHSQGSVSYQELQKWRNLFFDCFTIFVTKGVGLPISIIFFLK